MNYTVRNDILTAWAMSLVLWWALVIALRPSLLPYLLLQGVVGVLLLETVNYLEHSGLRRQRVDGGRREDDPLEGREDASDMAALLGMCERSRRAQRVKVAR